MQSTELERGAGGQWPAATVVQGKAERKTTSLWCGGLPGAAQPAGQRGMASLPINTAPTRGAVAGRCAQHTARAGWQERGGDPFSSLQWAAGCSALQGGAGWPPFQSTRHRRAGR